MEDKSIQDTGKSNRNSKIQLSKKVQATPISMWLRVWANDQTRSSHSREQSHFRAAKEVSPVARTLLPFQWRMMKHIAMDSWLNRLKIHALFSSCLVLICYTIVTHLLLNIKPHLLVVTTTLFLYCLSRVQDLGKIVSYHTLLECLRKSGVWLFFGILAAGEIKKTKKNKK